MWLVEEEKRYTTGGTRTTANKKLWLVEEEKRYTTGIVATEDGQSCGLLKKRRDIQRKRFYP